MKELNMLRPKSAPPKKKKRKRQWKSNNPTPNAKDLITWEWDHSDSSHGWTIERRTDYTHDSPYYECIHHPSGMRLQLERIRSLNRAKACCEFMHQFIPDKYKTEGDVKVLQIVDVEDEEYDDLYDDTY